MPAFLAWSAREPGLRRCGRAVACFWESPPKVVPFCSILFHFLCAGLEFWEGVGAHLGYKWTQMRHFWNESGTWPRAAACLPNRQAQLRMWSAVHGGILARPFVGIKDGLKTAVV